MSDSRQLSLVGTGSELARPLHERFLDAIGAAWEHVLAPESANTKAAYFARWKHWCLFCEAVGMDPLPIEPARLLGYLNLLSQTHAPNTVRLALYALASLDQVSRITPTNPDPPSLAKSVAVQRWMEGWSREHPRRPKKRAAVVRPNELRAILDKARDLEHRQSRAGHIPRYARDRAMLLIGYTSGLRISNIVLLDYQDVRTTARGLELTRRRAKNDQFGDGKVISVLPQANVLMCPVNAWNAWVAVRGSMDGPAFCPIDRQGTVEHEKRLTKRSAQRMIGERAKRAGVELMTSHSLRRSMATVALEKGKGLASVRKQGDWTSFDSLSPYIEDAELWNDNPSSGLLDEVE